MYPKLSGLSYKEIYAYNNKHSLRSNTKGYGSKTHYTGSQNSDTIAPNSRELYHLQFSLQAASPETFGYNLVYGLLQYSTHALISTVTRKKLTTWQLYGWWLSTKEGWGYYVING
jgi:hypothetical protein